MPSNYKKIQSNKKLIKYSTFLEYKFKYDRENVCNQLQRDVNIKLI